MLEVELEDEVADLARVLRHHENACQVGGAPGGHS
jgi:hypothetical protein